MNELLSTELILAATILWIGFVTSISFMEAWLKFRAPGVTLKIGLGIGQLVFGALNKVELVLALLIGIAGLGVPSFWNGSESFSYFIPVGLLLIQTFWLLPALNKRIKAHRANVPIPKSRIHFIYIAAELLKVASLVVWALCLLSTINEMF